MTKAFRIRERIGFIHHLEIISEKFLMVLDWLCFGMDGTSQELPVAEENTTVALLKAMSDG